jgi:hypothetical protein
VNPGPAYRCLCLIIAVASLMSTTGCATFSRFWLRNPNQLASNPLPRFSDDPQLEEVVDHLNRNVERLHAWRAGSVKIRANNMPGLSGSLVVEEGSHLRMVVNSLAGHEVDMGSNDDVFWIWAKRMEPSYVYCRHDQIELARQSLGVPFEPQWLMQALGVAPLETRDLTMKIDPAAHQAMLVQPIYSAHGQPLQNVMLVDLIRGVITEHSIHNAQGQKLAIAKLDDFRVDKQSGAVLPHRVRLDWPQNQMSLVMNMGHIEINPPTIPTQIWDMPSMSGVQAVNLGIEARPGVRVVGVPSDGLQGIETESPEGDSEGSGLEMTLDDSFESEVPIQRQRVSPTGNSVEHGTLPIERPADIPAKQPGERAWFDE